METIKPREIRKAVVCVLQDAMNNQMAVIDIEPVNGEPYCELCKSYQCVHVKYASALKEVKAEQERMLKRICKGCNNYVLEDGIYCDQCGEKLEAKNESD